ncbi:MAG TPA: nucleotidyltransferase domain-containing protein [Methylocella sp.]|nr:nucleotidyltransferase domain-containing protein [Methylocella sp.]
MTSEKHIDVQPAHLALVSKILGAHLPATARVFVFGSRVADRARPLSDLDLLIDAGRPLTLDETAALAEAFCESDLPYKVDLADWHVIEGWLRHVIEPQRVELRPRDAARAR